MGCLLNGMTDAVQYVVKLMNSSVDSDTIGYYTYGFYGFRLAQLEMRPHNVPITVNKETTVGRHSISPTQHLQCRTTI